MLPDPDGTEHDLLSVSLLPVALRGDACDHIPHSFLDDGQVEFFLAQQSQLAAVP